MGYGERLMGALGRGPFSGGMLGSFLEAGDPSGAGAPKAGQPGQGGPQGPPVLPALPVQAAPVAQPVQSPAPFGIRVPDRSPIGPSIFDRTE